MPIVPLGTVLNDQEGTTARESRHFKCHRLASAISGVQIFCENIQAEKANEYNKLPKQYFFNKKKNYVAFGYLKLIQFFALLKHQKCIN